MTYGTQRSTARDSSQLAAAIVLIVIGVIGIVTQLWRPSADIGGWVVGAIGLGFLAVFAATRQYRYAVPGGIMTGLGAGIVVSQIVHWTTTEGEGGAVVLGLGLGFLSILVLQAFAEEVRNRWWPVIPGGILGAVGVALLIGGKAIQALDYWGVAIVAIGLIVLWRALTTRPAET